MTANNYISVDLFAGAGGLSEGLRSAGFRCLWANEFDKHAAATFATNFPEAYVSKEDIRSLSPAEIRSSLGLAPGQIDAVVGGPPCQGFSTYGKRDSGDPRNQLYVNFFAFVEEFCPKVFVMENVAGILTMGVIEDVLGRASRLGYQTGVHTVCAEEYGVPQRRKRVFIIGSKLGAVRFVPPTHASAREGDLFSTVSPVVTVREAISDLCNIQVLEPAETQQTIPYAACPPESSYQKMMRTGSSAITHHSAKRMLGIRAMRLALLRPGDYGREMRERIEGEGLPYELIDQLLTGSNQRELEGCRRQDIDKERQLREMLHEGHHSVTQILEFLDPGGFANKYRRLQWGEPSHTLVAHMARDCSDFVHPELNRFISVREAARLQSFPDVFTFPGSQFQQFKQIGNAVPPLLARAVGDSIASALNRDTAGSNRSLQTKPSNLPVLV